LNRNPDKAEVLSSKLKYLHSNLEEFSQTMDVLSRTSARTKTMQIFYNGIQLERTLLKDGRNSIA